MSDDLEQVPPPVLVRYKATSWDADGMSRTLAGEVMSDRITGGLGHWYIDGNLFDSSWSVEFEIDWGKYPLPTF